MKFKELFEKIERYRVWFPKKTADYLSNYIKANSFEQAFSSYLVGDSLNSIWKNFSVIIYNNKEWEYSQRKILHKIITKYNDWDGANEI